MVGVIGTPAGNGHPRSVLRPIVRLVRVLQHDADHHRLGIVRGRHIDEARLNRGRHNERNLANPNVRVHPRVHVDDPRLPHVQGRDTPGEGRTLDPGHPRVRGPVRDVHEGIQGQVEHRGSRRPRPGIPVDHVEPEHRAGSNRFRGIPRELDAHVRGHKRHLQVNTIVLLVDLRPATAHDDGDVKGHRRRVEGIGAQGDGEGNAFAGRKGSHIEDEGDQAARFQGSVVLLGEDEVHARGQRQGHLNRRGRGFPLVGDAQLQAEIIPQR